MSNFSCIGWWDILDIQLCQSQRVWFCRAVWEGAATVSLCHTGEEQNRQKKSQTADGFQENHEAHTHIDKHSNTSATSLFFFFFPRSHSVHKSAAQTRSGDTRNPQHTSDLADTLTSCSVWGRGRPVHCHLAQQKQILSLWGEKRSRLCFDWGRRASPEQDWRTLPDCSTNVVPSCLYSPKWTNRLE